MNTENGGTEEKKDSFSSSSASASSFLRSKSNSTPVEKNKEEAQSEEIFSKGVFKVMLVIYRDPVIKRKLKIHRRYIFYTNDYNLWFVNK